MEPSAKDMITDFAEKHDEYLIFLQQRNRILRHLRKKDPMQLKLEHLEQGFSLYVNGANLELRNYPGKSSSQATLRSELKSAKRNDSVPPVQIKELKPLECRAQTAPSKIQRKGWLQKTLQIKTESESMLCIEPPSEYSDDFEPYDSLNMEENDDHPAVYFQNIKSPSNSSPSGIRFSNLSSDLQVSSSVEKERILLSIDDVKELRRSLELNVSQKRMEKDCSSDDYDFVEEDMLSEPSLMEETISSFASLQLHSNESLKKDVIKDQATGTCCDLDALPVLEFRSQSEKPEKNLSSKRKDDAESYIPIRPITIKGPLSQLDGPLSATQKNVCQKKNREHSASSIIKAMQLENDVLQKAILCRRQETSESHQRLPSVSTSAFSATTEPSEKHQETTVITEAIERIALLGSRQQKKLLKVLQKFESLAVCHDHIVIDIEEPESDPVMAVPMD